MTSNGNVDLIWGGDVLLLGGLFLSGVVAGAMNAVAGGGSFVTFPVLVLAGLPPIVANASSTVALFPGGLGSLWAFRHDIRARFAGVRLAMMALVSVAGGLAGAVLLLSTPQRTFDEVVPWVLLLATLTYAFGRQIGARRRSGLQAPPGVVLALQGILSLYGGYFGGAVGIMMMAAWQVVTTVDAKVMNPHRSLLVNAANAAAVACFVASGQVAWAATLAMLLGAVAGGYGGAVYARRLSARLIRAAVLLVSVVVTAGFFVRLL